MTQRPSFVCLPLQLIQRHPPDTCQILLVRQDAVFRVLVDGADLKPVRTVYSLDGLKVYRTPDDAACVALQARQTPHTL